MGAEVLGTLDQWACERGVELAFIRPGKPIENQDSSFTETWFGLCEIYVEGRREEG